MSISVKALFPILVGLATASAQAQLLPTWETNIVLTQQDLDMIHGAVTNRVHGKPVGTTASWSNPAPETRAQSGWSRNSVLKTSNARTLKYTVRSGGSPVYS